MSVLMNGSNEILAWAGDCVNVKDWMRGWAEREYRFERSWENCKPMPDAWMSRFAVNDDKRRVTIQTRPRD